MPQNAQIPIPSVPASYGTPFADWLDRLAAVCNDPELPQSVFLAKVEALVAELPNLPLDWVALAVHLESAMGQAALTGAIASVQRVGVRSQASGIRSQASGVRSQEALFAADPVQLPHATFAPLADAVAKLDRRTPVGAKLSSRQWGAVALELRERAFFSARVESIRFLAATQNMIHKRLSLIRDELVPGRPAFVDRGSFILAARQIAEQEGLDTTDHPSQRGTIRDIRSTARLGLIYDMQTKMAQEYARWHMDHDADVLDAYPAQRFERIESRRVPRPDGFWESRWTEAGDACGWQGALQSPMVALKTSPIWQGLSIFGTPWPPFDYGSGWGVEDVDREESDALGLTKPALPVPAFDGGSGRDINAETGGEMGFNDVLEASVKDWRPDQVATLKGAFGDQVEEREKKVQWQGNLIRDFVDRALRDRSWNGKAVSLGKATERTVAKVGDLANVENAVLKIDPSHIRKTWRDHGPVDDYAPGSGERRRGHIPLGSADYELLPHVWRDPDEVKPGDKPGDLVFGKRILDRMVGATWTVSEGKTMLLKSLYKQK